MKPAALIVLVVALAGCGPKRPQTTHLPAPPEITPPSETATPPEVASSTEPSNEAAPESRTELSALTVPPLKIPDLQHAKPIFVEEGIASWYGPPYHNRRGANGEIYDMNAATAAHRTLPLNSLVRVTNVATGRSTIVRITDRGPFIAGRVLDLSLAAAKQLDVWRAGTARVRIEVLATPAPLDRGGRWCIQIGAFNDAKSAHKLKSKIEHRYHTADVRQFTGPTGEWLRIRVADDDKQRAVAMMQETKTSEGAVFLVRMD